MPSYDLVCPSCRIGWEGFSLIKDKDKIKCPFCKKANGITQITCKSDPKYWCVMDTAYDEAADITYTGPGDLRKQVKEKGLTEVHR